MKLLALVAIAACYTAPVPARPRVVTLQDQVPCLVVAPPQPPPPIDCVRAGIVDVIDCEHMESAAWSDYGRRVNTWVRLYAWPACSEVRP